MKTQDTGLKRIFKAFTYSYDGFKAAFKNEAALRQDILFCGIFLIATLFISVGTISKILMISSLFLILFMELINTAIETVIDRISDDYHELSKKAKDIGSLLVLLAFIHMAFVWGYVLIDRFL